MPIVFSEVNRLRSCVVFEPGAFEERLNVGVASFGNSISFDPSQPEINWTGVIARLPKNVNVDLPTVDSLLADKTYECFSESVHRIVLDGIARDRVSYALRIEVARFMSVNFMHYVIKHGGQQVGAFTVEMHRGRQYACFGSAARMMKDMTQRVEIGYSIV